MRIKVDEDLPIAVAILLREHNYQVESVSDQGMSGWKDPALWQAVQNEARFLITADKAQRPRRSRHLPPGERYRTGSGGEEVNVDEVS